MVNENEKEIVKTLTEELLRSLRLEGEVVVNSSPDDDEALLVNITTPESGLLIGYHGETLSSFQLLLGLIGHKRLGRWVKLVVEVGDYRAKRAEQLKSLAVAYANQAITTRQPVYLPPMSPLERRVIHLALKDHTEVETESVGEGHSRRVVVKPKQ